MRPTALLLGLGFAGVELRGLHGGSRPVAGDDQLLAPLVLGALADRFGLEAALLLLVLQPILLLFLSLGSFPAHARNDP